MYDQLSAVIFQGWVDTLDKNHNTDTILGYSEDIEYDGCHTITVYAERDAEFLGYHYEKLRDLRNLFKKRGPEYNVCLRLVDYYEETRNSDDSGIPEAIVKNIIKTSRAQDKNVFIPVISDIEDCLLEWGKMFGKESLLNITYMLKSSFAINKKFNYILDIYTTDTSVIFGNGGEHVHWLKEILAKRYPERDFAINVYEANQVLI